MLPRRRCVYQHADDKGIIGVELNKQLVQVAGKSLQVRSHLVAAREIRCRLLSRYSRSGYPGTQPWLAISSCFRPS